MTEPDTRRLERYLLGDLPEAEMERLDRRLLADPEAFANAAAAEDDLVDAYVRGELSRRDRARFRRRLLGTERIARRVAAARALAATADGDAAAGRATGAADVVPLRERRAPAAARWAWAATLVALIGGGVFAWQAVELRQEVEALRARAGAGDPRVAEAAAARTEAERLRSELAAAESRNEEERRQIAAQRDRLAALEAEVDRLESAARRAADAGAGAGAQRPAPVERISFALALATRAASVPELRVPEGVDEVELELGLDGYRGAAALDGVVSRRGVSVWTAPGLPVTQGTRRGEPATVRLRLPAASLAEGTYEVRLTSADGTLVGAYELKIVRS